MEGIHGKSRAICHPCPSLTPLQAPQTGRKYYYNTSTKVTTWTEPSELKELRDKKAAAEPPADDASAAAVSSPAVPVVASMASAQAKADAAAGEELGVTSIDAMVAATMMCDFL